MFDFTDVHLSLKGSVIPNNSYVKIHDIGSTDDTALNCHINKNLYYTGADWFTPDGTRVGDDDDDLYGDGEEEGYYSDIGYKVVRLKKTNTPFEGILPEGIYHCSDECTTNKIYVGLYNSRGGIVSIFNTILLLSYMTQQDRLCSLSRVL